MSLFHLINIPVKRVGFVFASVVPQANFLFVFKTDLQIGYLMTPLRTGNVQTDLCITDNMNAAEMMLHFRLVCAASTLVYVLIYSYCIKNFTKRSEIILLRWDLSEALKFYFKDITFYFIYSFKVLMIEKIQMNIASKTVKHISNSLVSPHSWLSFKTPEDLRGAQALVD